MKALIITDGTDSMESIALEIKKSLIDFDVDICSAQNFEGNELLPADLFLLGCESPSPLSFAFLEQMLSHINLASRKCGVFSVNEESNQYLLSIVKDCEAYTGEPLFIENGKVEEDVIKNWLKQF